MRHRFDVHLLLHKRQINIEGVQCHLLDWHFLSELRKIIEKINPSIIINAVALTDVDNCEKYRGEAHKTNVEIARDLAILSCDLDAKFIQISTDQLFDGKGTFYSEIEEPNPLNEYGLTKWRAEEAVSHEQKIH